MNSLGDSINRRKWKFLEVGPIGGSRPQEGCSWVSYLFYYWLLTHSLCFLAATRRSAALLSQPSDSTMIYLLSDYTKAQKQQKQIPCLSSVKQRQSNSSLLEIDFFKFVTEKKNQHKYKSIKCVFCYGTSILLRAQKEAQYKCVKLPQSHSFSNGKVKLIAQ